MMVYCIVCVYIGIVLFVIIIGIEWYWYITIQYHYNTNIDQLDPAHSQRSPGESLADPLPPRKSDPPRYGHVVHLGVMDIHPTWMASYRVFSIVMTTPQ